MKHLVTAARSLFFALLGTSLLPMSALAQSAVSWPSLRMAGQAHPRPWCGQWWGYRCNGIAINNKNNHIPSMTCGYDDALSPAEKLDYAAGRRHRIEHAKLDKWLQCSLAAWASCQNIVGVDRVKCLIDSSKSAAYLACATNAAYRFTVDTAYDHELAYKGQGAFGWDMWWGQSNGWGAAAVLYPEPTRAVLPAQQKPEVFGRRWKPQTFSVADVKGLLSSVHNDVDLAADGWFGCRYDGPGMTRLGASCRSDEDAYQDVTPRQMIDALSKHVGADRHGVVIDRHTDWEVWNQPLWKYEVTDCRESADVALCGEGATKKTCTLSFTWAEDGVGHGEVCVPPHGYTTRSLGFSLCVRADNILPDRKNQRWEVPDSVAKSERWPDFMWVPGNFSEHPTFGNPFVHKHFDQIVELAALAAGDVTPPSLKRVKRYKKEIAARIPNNNATGLTKAIDVRDDFPVKGVAVCVDITHPTRNELVVSLEGPHKAPPQLLWNRSSGAEDDIKDCIDASGETSYNKSAKGTWTVKVVDATPGAVGTWNSVTLKLMY